MFQWIAPSERLFLNLFGPGGDRLESAPVGKMRINLEPSSVRSAAVGSARSLRARRRRCTPRRFWQTAIALPVAGCNFAPTMDLLGSYFPAWMLCAALGVAAAVIIRQLLAVAGINDYVVAPLLTYTGLALSVTLLAWLVWFGH